MASGLALSQIGQIAINIHDLDRAVAFYRDVLGMKLLFQVPPKMAFFDCNGVRLMLDIPEDAEFNHPASILYYKVDDLHAAWAALREHGADLRHEPNLVARMPDHELWMAFFRDTEGNTLGLMSEVRSPQGLP
jgi:predicted enzyme related to lactoylglutathione lyase